ncbi:MAG: hypothetical protein IPK29_14900 [Betaproteobacteria bacterium]|nr:hypothetical protein [Betaproteobacteria bacterium]
MFFLVTVFSHVPTSTSKDLHPEASPGCALESVVVQAPCALPVIEAMLFAPAANGLASRAERPRGRRTTELATGPGQTLVLRFQSGLRWALPPATRPTVSWARVCTPGATRAERETVLVEELRRSGAAYMVYPGEGVRCDVP